MFDEHFGCFPCYSGGSWWFVTGPSAATLSVVIITINKYKYGVQWLLFKVSVMKLCYLIFLLFNYYLI